MVPAEQRPNSAEFPAEGCWSGAHSRALDRLAIEEYQIPSLLLMEHASIGIALQCLKQLQTGDAFVEIVCGPGNNGGDGVAIARHLHNVGIEVQVWDLLPADRRSHDTDRAVQIAIARRLGIPILDCSETLPESNRARDLRIDAIFGTGLKRPPRGIFRKAIEDLNRQTPPVLAVDLPSGLDSDSGLPQDLAVGATVTVTLGLPKRGFLAEGAALFTGALYCVPIGVSGNLLPTGVPAFPPLPHRVRRVGEDFEIVPI